MAPTTIIFETSADVVSGLDRAAAVQHRDRNAILEDALFQYLASDQEFRAVVEEGIRQADAGELIDHSEIQAMIAGWEKQESKA